MARDRTCGRVSQTTERRLKERDEEKTKRERDEEKARIKEARYIMAPRRMIDLGIACLNKALVLVHITHAQAPSMIAFVVLFSRLTFSHHVLSSYCIWV